MSQSVLRVLSIQSHVVSGYVGNKSATFPLQLLGFEVDPLNSVDFSNHSGYKVIRKGRVQTESDLDDLIEGLMANQLDYYTHLLTGYIYSDKFLTKVADLVKHLKKVNPNLIYVCDPVMGDNGRMYVPKELVDIYKTLIVPLADITTPNSYEAHLLTDLPLRTRDEVCAAVDKLHAFGVKTVVVSSTESGSENNLLILGSSNSDKTQTIAEINIQKIGGHFTGTGDLFAALFLAWMQKSGNDLPVALEKATSTLQAVLKRTNDYVLKVGRGEPTRHDQELKLIQSKADIESPTIVCKATVKVLQK